MRGSARGWANKVSGKRVVFNAEKRRFVCQLVETLDNQIAANS
jgi:hypothetical protein